MPPFNENRPPFHDTFEQDLKESDLYQKSKIDKAIESENTDMLAIALELIKKASNDEIKNDVTDLLFDAIQAIEKTPISLWATTQKKLIKNIALELIKKGISFHKKYQNEKIWYKVVKLAIESKNTDMPEIALELIKKASNDDKIENDAQKLIFNAIKKISTSYSAITQMEPIKDIALALIEKSGDEIKKHAPELLCDAIEKISTSYNNTRRKLIKDIALALIEKSGDEIKKHVPELIYYAIEKISTSYNDTSYIKEIALYLINKGVNFHKTDKHGQKIWYKVVKLAIEKKNTDMLTIALALLEKASDSEIENYATDLLSDAIEKISNTSYNNAKKLIQDIALLINKGVNFHKTDDDGNTLCHLAAMEGQSRDSPKVDRLGSSQ